MTIAVANQDQEMITRKFLAVDESGKPRYSVTRHGTPRQADGMAEWVARRVAGLGIAGSRPAGRVVVRLLEAEGDKAVAAAVAAGRELDPQDRWAVLQCLEACRAAAGEYPPAGARMRELASAWTSKYGSEQPFQRSGAI
jgi:hypothetical protein